MLNSAGYVCGLSGKWHLGANLTPSEGFSSWVTKPDGSTREFYDQDIIEDGKVRKEAGYTTDLWTRKGIEFIEQNKDRPFFLFLAYNGPYALGNLMLNRSRNRHAEHYLGKHFASFPVDTMHPWQHANQQFHNKQVAMERTACEVSGVDDGVGDVMATLKRLGLEDDTLVVYASDQGWMGGQNGMWGMGDHFRPTGAHEMMMKIPLIFRHTGQIPASQTSNLLVSNYDFIPSVLSYLGLSEKLPTKPRSPGRDFSPVLRGKPFEWNNVVFYEMETTSPDGSVCRTEVICGQVVCDFERVVRRSLRVSRLRARRWDRRRFRLIDFRRRRNLRTHCLTMRSAEGLDRSPRVVA